MLAKKPTRPPPSGVVHWLISKDENGRAEMLTIDFGGEEMLPVFSFREEAEMFLSLGTMGGGWSLRRATAGELASTLMGPCTYINFVALDPMPEIARRGTAGLVGISRERFMHRLAKRLEPLASRGCPESAQARMPLAPAR